MKLAIFLQTIIAAIIITCMMPLSTKALDIHTAPGNITVKDTTGSAAVYSKLITRLSEIQSMDKESLSASEKKSLRTELKDMKKAADGLDRRVYISVGGIIIAILLLILILR